jgi:hypothetical protein
MKATKNNVIIYTGYEKTQLLTCERYGCQQMPTKKTFKLQTILVMLPPLAKLLQLYCVAELVDAVRPKPILVDGLKNWTLGLAGNP